MVAYPHSRFAPFSEVQDHYFLLAQLFCAAVKKSGVDCKGAIRLAETGDAVVDRLAQILKECSEATYVIGSKTYKLCLDPALSNKDRVRMLRSRKVHTKGVTKFLREKTVPPTAGGSGAKHKRQYRLVHARQEVPVTTLVAELRAHGYAPAGFTEFLSFVLDYRDVRFPSVILAIGSARSDAFVPCLMPSCGKDIFLRGFYLKDTIRKGDALLMRILQANIT